MPKLSAFRDFKHFINQIISSIDLSVKHFALIKIREHLIVFACFIMPRKSSYLPIFGQNLARSIKVMVFVQMVMFGFVRKRFTHSKSFRTNQMFFLASLRQQANQPVQVKQLADNHRQPIDRIFARWFKTNTVVKNVFIKPSFGNFLWCFYRSNNFAVEVVGQIPSCSQVCGLSYLYPKSTCVLALPAILVCPLASPILPLFTSITQRNYKVTKYAMSNAWCRIIQMPRYSMSSTTSGW